MKKLCYLLCLLPFLSTAQINKGNWLVGGVVGGSYTKAEEFKSNYTEEITSRSANILGQVAYFPIKKLAIGLNTQFTSSRDQYFITSRFPSFSQRYEVSDQIFAMGPFVRYYLLTPESKFNLYVQGSFQGGNIKRESFSMIELGGLPILDEASLTAYHLGVAPVYFINKKVALEFVLNYSRLNHIEESNRFAAAIGLQVHLGK
jgi:hypothetical protein